MTVRWRPLAPGEPVGLVAFSGPVQPALLERGLAMLAELGVAVVAAPNLGSARGYLAGSDEERLAALTAVLDRGARVLWAARGGYGAGRLLARLPWQRMVADDIVVIGFSDTTAVMNPLLARGGAAQIHGPMAATDLTTPESLAAVLAMVSAPAGSQWTGEVPAATVVRPGRVSGRALGGNLAVLASLAGGPHFPELEDAILFLEDVGEPAYRLDRMLTQVAASATFCGVKALVVGELRDCVGVGNGAPEWRELLLSAAPADAVVIDGLCFGHGPVNLPFPLGVTVDVDTANARIVWST